MSTAGVAKGSSARRWRFSNRPFPWCLLPDGAWFFQGSILLFFISLPAACMIGSTFAYASIVNATQYFWVGRKITDVLQRSISSASKWVGQRIMLDPRNSPYLPWTVVESLVLPYMIFVCWRRHTQYGFEPVTMLLYHLLRLGPRYRFFAHHHVLVHKEGHDKRGFFKPPFDSLNLINSVWCGLFYGTMPRSYSISHNKIHHRWHNDVDDVHTNLDFDRTEFTSYVTWLPRFFLYWTGVTPLIILIKRQELSLAFSLSLGMLYYWMVLYSVWCYVDLVFCIAYFVYPLCESAAFLGMIAYLWHGFVEPSDPSNQYINSITIVNGKDNIFNEDYHVVHHHAPSVHWTSMPAHYEATKAHYAECIGSVFQNCEQGEMIHWQFTRQFDQLAEHFVDLSGKLTHDQKVELLRRRLTYVKFPDDDEVTDWAGWGVSKQRDWDDRPKNE